MEQLANLDMPMKLVFFAWLLMNVYIVYLGVRKHINEVNSIEHEYFKVRELSED